jgi:AraC family transcriptional regulator
MTIPISMDTCAPSRLPRPMRRILVSAAGKCADVAALQGRPQVRGGLPGDLPKSWKSNDGPTPMTEAVTEWPVRGTKASHELAKVSVLVADLLANASNALDNDRETAMRCIVHAAAVVEKIGWRPPYEGQGVLKGGLAPWQARRLKAHIDANLADRITLDELSAVARLSTGHFSRAFKRSFGMAPFAFVKRRRVEHAQQLMLTTELPLCEIALKCGLYDQSHFSRLFRRTTGISPNAWRRFHRLGEPTLIAFD